MDERSGTILVVEDDGDIRTSLSELLEVEGYEVNSAGDGREALEKLRQQAGPCLILLDLIMPGMDGAALVEEMRSDDSLRHNRVVILSATGTRIEGEPVVAHLKKPLGVEDLLSVIEKHCAKKES